MAAQVNAKVNSAYEVHYHHHMTTGAAAVVNSAYEADHHHHMTTAADDDDDLEKSSDHMTSHVEHPILINPESSPGFLRGMDGDSDENHSRDCSFCADTGVPEAVTIIIGVEDEITTKHVDHYDSSSAAV
ncbi:hypothetical protein Droror1_Dr00010330 [Drosera rotundifolia]